jgi:hypothetical protein
MDYPGGRRYGGVRAGLSWTARGGAGADRPARFLFVTGLPTARDIAALTHDGAHTHIDGRGDGRRCNDRLGLRRGRTRGWSLPATANC